MTEIGRQVGEGRKWFVVDEQVNKHKKRGTVEPNSFLVWVQWKSERRKFSQQLSLSWAT